MSQQPNVVKLPLDQVLFKMIQEYLPDLEITLVDLKNPTHVSVCKFYTALLEELGANPTNMMQIQMNQMTLISHADMYNATIPILNLYHAVKYFLNYIGVTDFSLSDLTNPVTKRTISHFNSLMQFLAYCDKMISDLQPQLEEVSKLRSDRNELCSRIEALTSEINLRATERARRKEKLKEVEKDIKKEKELRDDNIAKKKVQEQLLEKVKNEVMEYEEKKTQLIRIIKNMESENENLDSMIVKSPEKLITDLEQLELKKQQCVEQVDSIRSQFEAKEKLSEIHIRENEKQKMRCETLGKLLDINKRLSEKRIKNDLLEKNYTTMMEKEEELNNKICSDQVKLKTFAASVVDLKARKEQKDAENKEILKNAEEEYKNLVKRRKEKTQLRDRIQMLINERTEDLERIKCDLQEYAAHCLKTHELLVEKENEYSAQCNAVCEKLQSDLQV